MSYEEFQVRTLSQLYSGKLRPIHANVYRHQEMGARKCQLLNHFFNGFIVLIDHFYIVLYITGSFYHCLAFQSPHEAL